MEHWEQAASMFHGVLASNNRIGLSELYVRTCNKRENWCCFMLLVGYNVTDNGFKQVQIDYLAVISNLDKLVYRRISNNSYKIK